MLHQLLFMSDVIKVGKADLDPGRTLGARFVIAPEHGPSFIIDAVVLGSGSPDLESEFVAAVQESIDDEGNRPRQYLKLPRRVMESANVVVEYFDSHENLKNAVGGVAIAGAIIIGSLVVRRPRYKQ